MTDQKDYYQLLGVERTASADELKAAFRKKALHYHPDRNSAPDAEDTFKALNGAYAVLSDPEKRARYDQFGHAGVDGAGDPFAGGFKAEDFRDIFGGDAFEQLFGSFFGGGSRSTARHGRDLQIELEIQLETVLNGKDRSITFNRRVKCEPCDGTGARKGTRPAACPACGGQGKVRVSRGFISMIQTCSRCTGTGEVIASPCSECSGQGVVPKSVTLEIPVPAGVRDGHRLRLDGQGHGGERGGLPGDLYVILRLAEHPFFRVDGDDIICEVPITYPQATLGTRLEVPTLSGKARLKVPGGTQSGKLLRMRGKGLPRLRNQRRGDQLVRLQIETPTQLSAEQRSLIEALGMSFDTERGEGSQPRRRSFLDQLKDLFG